MGRAESLDHFVGGVIVDLRKLGALLIAVGLGIKPRHAIGKALVARIPCGGPGVIAGVRVDARGAVQDWIVDQLLC